jgi:hypothetical protein
MGKLQTPQPGLFLAPIVKDVVYTPDWLAALLVAHFKPTGRVLDPCRGDGAFHSRIDGAEWCEVAEGRDFFAFGESFGESVDWIIGNPPYSYLLGWIRHSFKVAKNIVYLMPLHRVFASYEFMTDLQDYGGIPEILLIGTGRTAGFPFGHALGAVHYRRGYRGATRWTHMSAQGSAAGTRARGMSIVAKHLCGDGRGNDAETV